MPNITGIIRLILLATEATESPFFCAVRAIILNIAMNRKPNPNAATNQSDFMIIEGFKSPLYNKDPHIQAVI